MAQVYGEIDSLMNLVHKLQDAGITTLETLDDLKSFQDNYKKLLIDIEEKNKVLLQDETNNLKKQFEDLIKEYSKALIEREEYLKTQQKELHRLIIFYSTNVNNILLKIKYWYRRNGYIKRKQLLDDNFESELKEPFSNLFNEISKIKKEIEDNLENFDKIVEYKTKEESNKLGTINTILEDNKELHYGAMGEQKVADELNKLPNGYIVINNYKQEFHRAIHDKKNNEYIKSIQIDHIVIGPSGIYLIETKNWSKDTINNTELYSPVKQIQRSSLAFFIYLNSSIRNGYLPGFHKNWGTVQVSPKSIVVMLRHKPEQDYQFVKILSPSELNDYIWYGKKTFLDKEVNDLANFLLECTK